MYLRDICSDSYSSPEAAVSVTSLTLCLTSVETSFLVAGLQLLETRDSDQQRSKVCLVICGRVNKESTVCVLLHPHHKVG